MLLSKNKINEENTFLAEAVKLALAESNSVNEVRNALRQVGIFLHIENDKKQSPRKATDIAAVAFVDVKGKRAYTANEAKLQLDHLRGLPLRGDADRTRPLSEDTVKKLLIHKLQKPMPKAGAKVEPTRGHKR